jgi:NTP pyrophosphatase (non-canonical NTP hydrolase)
MKTEFLPQTMAGKLAHVAEECGEVVQSIGKAIRFGLDTENPVTHETARAAILRELKDLHFVAIALELALAERPKEDVP